MMRVLSCATALTVVCIPLLGQATRPALDRGTGTMRLCDRFPGETPDLKLAACIADLPADGGTADATGLQGTQNFASNPFSGVSKPVRLLVGNVTISTNVAWSLTTARQEIQGIPDRSVLKYTGDATTSVIVLDGSGCLKNGCQFGVFGLRVDANGRAAYGILLDAAVGSSLRDVSVTNSVTAGFGCRSCVLDAFVNPTVSSQIDKFSSTPLNGIVFESGGVLGGNSANQIQNARFEGLRGAGIKLVNSLNGVFVGGTSEGNGYGLEITPANPLDVSNNTFIGIDFESNVTRDIELTKAQNNVFVGINSNNPRSSVRLSSSAGLNKFIGGAYLVGPTVESGANGNAFYGLQVNSNISDSGMRTVIQGVYNGLSGAYQSNQMPVPLTYGETTNQQLGLSTLTGSYLYYASGGNNGFLATAGVAEVKAADKTVLEATANGVAIGQNANRVGPGTKDLLVQDQTATTGATEMVIKAGAADTNEAHIFSIENNAGKVNYEVDVRGGIRQSGVTFSNLPAVDNGYLIYCVDCRIVNPCAAGGTGAFAKRLNGTWVCNLVFVPWWYRRKIVLCLK